jgi:transposase-like protein/IS1 family transposase
MLCSTCQAESRKFGKDRHGNQRHQCMTCKKTFTDLPTRPLGDMRLPLDKAVFVLRCLVEGNSIRSTMRITGVNRSTIINLLLLIGSRCETMLKGRLKNIPVVDVQCDEVWSFVGMKEKTRLEKHPQATELGDAYCFTAIERESKLLLTWHLGTRCREDTVWFAAKLRDATEGNFQLTTDGFRPYALVMPAILPDADFAQLVKQYATKNDGKYSPGEVTGTVKTPINGHPDENKISTSHVERSNLTIRMGNRRFTRLTNAFSKKWANHLASLALTFAYYNFVRPHQTLKMTPAMAAGIEDHPWTLEELVLNCSTQS